MGITNIALRYGEKIHGFHQLTHSKTGNDLVAEPSQYFSFSDHSVKVQNNEISLYLNGLCSGCGILPKKDYLTFCCFTGLSYIDVKTLCPAHLYKDNEGKLWIHKARVKITTHKESCTCNVPLLEPALVILEKYKNWNPEDPEGPCFPIPSNQKMNEFLKEIATLCRVNKRLTVHVARHTFATTVTLANDVALQNVSKMLGHSSTRMTQHYARVLDNSIMKDMQDVARVFG